MDQATAAPGDAVPCAGFRAARGHPGHRGRSGHRPTLDRHQACRIRAEVIHADKPGGDVFRFTAPHLKRGPRIHGADKAGVIRNKLSLGLDFKQARDIGLPLALWSISDGWVEPSAPGTCGRNGITNELAKFEAVARTNGNSLPSFMGEGTVYGNRVLGFQPCDTFRCSDGRVFVGAVGGAIHDRVPRLLGLDPVEYGHDECSQDVAAVNASKWRELDARLRDQCTAHITLEVEMELNAARIARARILNVRDQYSDPHHSAHERTGRCLTGNRECPSASLASCRKCR